GGEAGGARGRAAAARARLAALGVRTSAADALAGALRVAEVGVPAVEVRTLGGLRVLRHGVPVPAGEWQSKKARDLLRLLLVRRGRPAPREVLMAELWPDEDPDRVGNRLSVLLSTLRAVLDPGRVHPPEHHVTGDRTTAALVVEHLDVDVERFLAGAAAGLAVAAVDPGAARARLEPVEALYGGDLFEDEPYADGAAPLREEARAAYLAVVRALGDAAGAAGDTDLAVRYRLRLLERDPFDEAAHLALVRALDAGDRHGEARRRHRLYRDRMAELGLPAAPFPAARTRLRVVRGTGDGRAPEGHAQGT
uniref:AfsR/SARP family transcriptional regulator n=1 Tax=Cellulomonas endophytica TaxID=2494735 RepID=UPI00196B5EFC